MDKREELINSICMYMISQGVKPDDAKNRLYVLFEPYEVTERCTELAELKKDRNQYLLNQFLVAKTVKGCSQRTIMQYAGQIKCILDRIGKNIDDITSEDIRYYLAIRQGREHISKVSADNERRYLNSFFGFLANEELIVRNPMAKVECIKHERKKKAAFTEIEVEKIRMAAADERERAVIETMLSTGCRVAELIMIRMDEIKNNRVLIHGKGAKDRYVYLNAKAVIAITEYQKTRTDKSPYLFVPKKNTEGRHLSSSAVESMTRSLAERAGIEQANPHKFRRTCATMALRRGMPIEQVSKMLGHEELSTTQIYLDLTEDELEQAHKKYVV